MATDPRRRRVLIAGWFSFDEGHATAGDLAAMELVRTWACVVDVAAVAPLADGIDWRTAPPSSYTHAIFVCGPFARGVEMELAFLDRFKTCRTLGVNLSMLVPLDEWSPFDTLLERDSTRTVRPDISLASSLVPVPLIGRCLVEPYGQALVETANRVIQQLVEPGAGAVIEIDTRLDRNATGFRSAEEVGSAIARMDVIITTRLHGMVLALKHGVPAIAIDPEPAIGKICRLMCLAGRSPCRPTP